MLLTGNRLKDQQDIAANLEANGLTATDARFRDVLDYWYGLKEGDCLPGRRHLRPEEIRSVLPYLVLYDVAASPDDAGPAAENLDQLQRGYRFRVRLAGTHFVELLGQEISGRYLDETTHSTCYPMLHHRLATVVQTKRPCFGVATLPNPDRNFIRYAHLTLPLAEDGQHVDMLLGVRISLDELSAGGYAASPYAQMPLKAIAC